MPAQTRHSNKTTTYKACYSKKAPKQVYFPHERKVVREKPGAWEPTSRQPRQLTFIPEKLRVGNIVRDSDGEDEEDEEDLSSAEPAREADVEVEAEEDARNPGGGRTRRKRSSDALREEAHQDEEDAARSVRKRTRHSAKNAQRPPTVKAEPTSDDGVSPQRSYASPSETDVEQDRRTRRRRQSTMTQLVEGRMPNESDSEPEFRPVKRTLRRSNSSGNDKKQRTLTQMVPGLTPVPVTSDEETEEEALDGAYGDALARCLNQDAVAEPATQTPSSSLPVDVPQSHPKVGAGIADIEDDEDEYYPTQHIPAPALRRRQAPGRIGSWASLTSPALTKEVSTPRKTPKSRYGLLATPERRKICEIPSSQSPPETPLSTQVTPAHDRAPLAELSSAVRNIQDTPSKRKKVMFSDVVKTAPQSASKHRFGDAVPDSEDEDDDLQDFDEESGSACEGQSIGVETQMQVNAIDHLARCEDAGAETQAELELINQACAWAEEDETSNDHHIPAELGKAAAVAIQEDEEFQGPPSNQQGALDQPTEDEAAQQSREETQPTLRLSTAPPQSSLTVDPVNLSFAPQSKPMPQDKEIQNTTTHLHPSQVPAPSQHHPFTLHPGSIELDLDGHPIQVRRSPPPGTETQETNRSFSSKAEQQLQLEWSTSQFPMGNLHAASAEAMPPPPHWHPATQASQATTLDPTQWSPNVTPKKTQRTQPYLDITPRKPQRTPAITPKREERARSATVTPHRIPNSQPFTSPARPDTLVIPSSFPTPSKTLGFGIGEWSSPVLGRGEGDSLDDMDDFSIPAMPPMVDEENGEDYEL